MNVAEWLATFPSEQTRTRYQYELDRLLKAIGKTPDQLLSDLEANPKQTSIAIKTHLGSIQSKTVALVQRAAVKSFCDFNECDLRLNGLKIRSTRTWRKPYVTWEQAEKVITECKEPYRSVYRFMLWAGIGVDEFAEIQNSAQIQGEIEKQRANDKPYIRIDLRPRKKAIDNYFILVPKEYVPRFPVLSIVYGPRGGQPVATGHLDAYWSNATKRAGLRSVGFGPHTLRSVFRSQCVKAGVADAVAEFQLGHGPRDRYGYSREVQDESYVATELAKLWKGMVPVTPAELDKRDQLIAEQGAAIKRLQEQLLALGVREYERAVAEGKVPYTITTDDGPRFLSKRKS